MPGQARAEWLAARQAELLPVPYFHVVFTLPAPVAEIAFQNKATVYAILFRAAAETLRTIAADPKHLGAEIGLVAVLHTWGQNLHHHPHVHCVVPGGGPSLDGTRWIACRPGFFLPVRVLSRLFRRLFLERPACRLRRPAISASSASSPGSRDPPPSPAASATLRRVEWVVYAKPPFGGPAQVLAYLGRYTHRVAIANSRLVSLTDGQVTFRWKDYRHHGKTKVMTLAADEFIRRFLLHTLPDGFHRIRHYGFLANGQRAAKLALCRRLLDAIAQETAAEPEHDRPAATRPPCCPAAAGAMVMLGILPTPDGLPRLPSGATVHETASTACSMASARADCLCAPACICLRRVPEPARSGSAPVTVTGRIQRDHRHRAVAVGTIRLADRSSHMRSVRPSSSNSGLTSHAYNPHSRAPPSRGFAQSGFNEVLPDLGLPSVRPRPTSQNPPDSDAMLG